MLPEPQSVSPPGDSNVWIIIYVLPHGTPSGLHGFKG